MDNIAVIMNEINMIDSFSKDANVLVFNKNDAGWLVVKDISAGIDFSHELPLLREELRQLITELDDCKIIVGKTVSGLAYHMLDKMGFAIFEVEQFTPSILDQILSDVKSASATNKSGISPVETDVPGVYFLDLIALQEQNSEITSKMALQPFLTNTPFLQVDLICGHLPPWVEPFIAAKGMKLTTEYMPNGKVQVHITKACC